MTSFIASKKSRQEFLPLVGKYIDLAHVEPSFHRVTTALRYELKCSCLARKVVKWYGETQGKGAELQYRFTGKESRMFCQTS